MELRRRRKLAATNTTESLTMGATERILLTVAQLYDSEEASLSPGPRHSLGLKQIASSPLVRVQLHKPRRKVSVMIVGNHSAGKSSFINWYVGETIQKTGVAIETKGFTFITSGKRRETLKGEATLMFYDHLDGLDKFEGLLSNLFTEVSSSKERNFTCVDFIDTPGLVDGDIHYAYDVDGAILWLADHVDLILVFFDPIGQALTARTMEIVQRLSIKHNEKLMFYMSKADQVEREDDRQRVLIQITQNVTSRIKSTHAFKLPTFYLPLPGDDLRPRATIPNAIDDICEEIDKAVKLTVQKNLSSLKRDCGTINTTIETKQREDNEARRQNRMRSRYGFLLMLTSWAMIGSMLLVGLHIGLSFKHSADFLYIMLEKILDSNDMETLARFMPPRGGSLDMVTYGTAIGILFVLYIIFSIATKVVWKAAPVLSRSEGTQLKHYKTHLESVLNLREGLYKEYFKQLHNGV